MEYIVEPFCGTSAMSYYIHTLHPLEFKYVLNDNNQHLIELYNILKDERLTKIFIDEIMLLMSDINKEKHYKIIREETVWGWYMRIKYSILETAGKTLTTPERLSCLGSPSSAWTNAL
jgi:site-specific DNA-adenine methylase